MASKRRIVKIASIVTTLIVIALALIPWRMLAEGRLVALLEAQGMKNVHLTVEGIGLSSLALKNVSVGAKIPVSFEQITINYSLSELWNKRLKGLVLSNLLLEAGNPGGVWGVSGLESFGGGSAGGSSIPVTPEAIPLEQASIEKSRLHINASFLQGDVPLQLSWQKSPAPTLDYTGTALAFKMGDVSATIGYTALHVTLKDKTWKGTWSSKAIALTGLLVDMPVTEASGTITADENHLGLQGTWGNDKANLKASFSFNYLFTTPARLSFTIQSFSMPWNGGKIRLKDVIIPLSGKQSYTVPVIIESVSVDALLQPLTGKRATATGTVSGTIPLTITPDGGFIFGAGALTALEPGTIVMAADAIPGDNAQITLLREVMKDFHYKLLSLGLDSDNKNKLSVTLSLEGNNPAVYNGRPVKLNVHLGGDVLDFIQQSMAVNDPQKLIKQGTHAK